VVREVRTLGEEARVPFQGRDPLDFQVAECGGGLGARQLGVVRDIDLVENPLAGLAQDGVDE
jgi:hypothetical protein